MPLSPSPSRPSPSSTSELDEHIAALQSTIATMDEALETARICLAEMQMQNLKLARARRAQIAQSNDRIIHAFTPARFRVVRPEIRR